jgi:cytochrome b involved in lipid metabolism
MENAGKDATEGFANAGHTDAAKTRLFEYIIGILEGHEDTPLKALAPAPKKSGVTPAKQAQGFNFGMLIVPIAVLAAIFYFYFK